jgi:hypothetical protein
MHTTHPIRRHAVLHISTSLHAPVSTRMEDLQSLVGGEPNGDATAAPAAEEPPMVEPEPEPEPVPLAEVWGVRSDAVAQRLSSLHEVRQ